jgi:hypothetical protein
MCAKLQPTARPRGSWDPGQQGLVFPALDSRSPLRQSEAASASRRRVRGNERSVGQCDCQTVFSVVPGERERDPGPIRRSFSMGHSVWVPAGACTRAGEAGPGCGDDSKRSLTPTNSQIQLSNSQAVSPVFFTEAPGRPVFLCPSPMAREWSAVKRNQAVQRLAALTCPCDQARSPHGAPFAAFLSTGPCFRARKTYPGGFRRPSSTPRPAIEGGPT